MRLYLYNFFPARRIAASIIIVSALITNLSCNDTPTVTQPPGANDDGIIDGETFDGPGDFYPAWNPKTDVVAYLSSYTDTMGVSQLRLQLVRLSTGGVRVISDVRDIKAYDLAWSPDGNWLLLTGPTGIFKIKPDGDSLTQLIADEGITSPTWSAASQCIYFSKSIGAIGLYSVLPDGSDIQKISPDYLHIVRPYCFPSTESLMVYDYRSPSDCISTFYPGDTVASPAFCGVSSVDRIRISSDHRMIYFVNIPIASALPIVMSIDRGGQHVDSICDGYSFDLSPTSDRLVYSDLLHSKGLRIINLADRDTTQITNPAGIVHPRN